MTKEKFFSIVFFNAGLYNLITAIVFCFPISVGRIVHLPDPGNIFYSYILSFFVFCFGCVYFLFSFQKLTDLSLVMLATVCKLGIFIITLLSFIVGLVPLLILLAAVVDLFFGFTFLWWILDKSRSHPTRYN